MSYECTAKNPCHDIDNCHCANMSPVCDEWVPSARPCCETCGNCGWDIEDHE